MSSSNNLLWDSIKSHEKELEILRNKLSQLSLQEHLDVLKYAFLIDDEANVWKHLLINEPLDFRNIDRSLTKGLFEIILDAAVYPGTHELKAQKILEVLVLDFPNYRELIYSSSKVHLDKADEACDFEVYERICNLLIGIHNDRLDEFLKRCRNHECAEIREIDEDWN